MGSHEQQFAAFKAAIATTEPPLLGPQKREGTRSTDDLSKALAHLFSAERIAPAIQPALRSAAFLWHDHLDASHTISQEISTREGSWLHGIMHRREPDFGNAKYWFRRVGQHDGFAPLAERVATLLHNDSDGLTERLIENGEWMPFAFVDECERAESGRPELQRALRDIQAVEFDVLVEFIFRRNT